MTLDEFTAQYSKTELKRMFALRQADELFAVFGWDADPNLTLTEAAWLGYEMATGSQYLETK